jgi:periplasmic divalent cation tolerance protein
VKQSGFVELILTCGSWQEAQKIADSLLEQRLVACVEFIDITSKNWWKHEIEASAEVKLIMQSVADNFKPVEKVVKKLHSYETPALHAIPIAAITDEAAAWLGAELVD